MKAYSLDLLPRVLTAALRGDRTIPQATALLGLSAASFDKRLRLSADYFPSPPPAPQRPAPTIHISCSSSLWPAADAEGGFFCP